MTEGPGLTTSGPQDFQPFRSFPDSYFLFSCFPFPDSCFLLLHRIQPALMPRGSVAMNQALSCGTIEQLNGALLVGLRRAGRAGPLERGTK